MSGKPDLQIGIGTDLTQFPPKDLRSWLANHRIWGETGLPEQYRTWQEVANYLINLSLIPKRISGIKSAIVGQKLEVIEKEEKLNK
jgi:hypothetical protein